MLCDRVGVLLAPCLASSLPFPARGRCGRKFLGRCHAQFLTAWRHGEQGDGTVTVRHGLAAQQRLQHGGLGLQLQEFLVVGC